MAGQTVKLGTFLSRGKKAYLDIRQRKEMEQRLLTQFGASYAPKVTMPSSRVHFAKVKLKTL